MTPWSRSFPHVGTSTPVLYNGKEAHVAVSTSGMRTLQGCQCSSSRRRDQRWDGFRGDQSKFAAAATVGFKAAATAVTCDAATSHTEFFVLPMQIASAVTVG